MTTRLVTVYRSSRVEEMYLFVDRTKGLRDVPAALLERFGTPQQVATLPLTPERRLARAPAAEVLANIDRTGFHLQMPPPPVPRSDAGVRVDYHPQAVEADERAKARRAAADAAADDRPAGDAGER